MTTTSPPLDPAPPDDRPPTVVDAPDLLASSKANRGDRAFSGLALTAGLLVLLILASILVTMSVQAWPAFRQEGLGFLTSDVWDKSAGRFGALALIYGTMVVSVLALLFAVPVSLGIALFSTQLAGPGTKRRIGLVIDLLAAIPSVVYGIWGAIVLGPSIDDVYAAIAGSIGTWPGLSMLFGEPVRGQSFMTAGIILACMITPIITSLSREVMLTVPPAQREAALALGATRWEMVRGAVFPWSRAGITGAVMLGLGRAMGETIAVALVIGSSPQITTKLFAPGDAMAGIIANEFGEASGTFQSALIGLGVVLFLITVLVNVAAQAIIRRVDRAAA